jgi:amino acid transporter
MSQSDAPSKQGGSKAGGGNPQGRADHGLKKNSLGVPSIVFYIIAAASPLTGVVAIVPIMIGLGNGVGTPGSFLVAAGILLLFAVGYLAMSKHVVNAGALYSYVTLGLGRVTGLGTAATTIFAYSCIQFSLYGGFGYYLQSLVMKTTGVDVPWWIFAVVAMLVTLFLGMRGVHAGGIVLGVAICLEIAMLLLLSIGLLNGGGGNTAPVSEFTFDAFSIPAIFAAGVGISIMFAQTTFIGFEGSAIYSEEAKNPRRTVPRATYIALVVMAVVYAGVSYLIIAGLGNENSVAIAQEQGGSLIFFVSNLALGPWASMIFEILIVTAIFAAIVTFHNNISRYLYSLGRQGLVWSRLGHTLPKAKTPHVAAIVQTVSALVVVLYFAAAGLDPYTTLFVWLAGIGTIAIIAAQAVTAVAIFAFFRKSNVDKRLWHTFLAPILSIIGLFGLLLIALSSLDLLLGAQGVLAAVLIGILVATPLLGIGYALYLKSRSPEKWNKMLVLLTTGE